MDDKRIKLILDEINENDRVLDIGCVHHCADLATSPNWLHGHLYNKSKYVIGVDYLESEVDKLKIAGYNVIQGDAENLKLNETFDIIIAGELIEHLSNPGLFLKSALNHLDYQGKLIITTPNAFNILNILSIIFYRAVSVHREHTCWYDKITLTQLIECNGFKVDKIVFIPSPTGAKGAQILNFFHSLGLTQLGGTGILVVCTIGDKEHEIVV